MVARRFETYLAGSVLLLLGLILLGYLSGFNSPRQIPAIFIAGVGVIFTLLAIFKARSPRQKYEMSPRTTFGVRCTSLDHRGVMVLDFSPNPNSRISASVATRVLRVSIPRLHALEVTLFGFCAAVLAELRSPWDHSPTFRALSYGRICWRGWAFGNVLATVRAEFGR